MATGGVSAFLYVRDLTASAEFYAVVLECQPSFSNDEVAIFSFAGGGELILHRDNPETFESPENPEGGVGRGRGVILHFTCADVDLRHKNLLASNIPVSLAPVSQSFGRRQMYLYDPDGYNLVVETRS